MGSVRDKPQSPIALGRAFYELGDALQTALVGGYLTNCLPIGRKHGRLCCTLGKYAKLLSSKLQEDISTFGAETLAIGAWVE